MQFAQSVGIEFGMSETLVAGKPAAPHSFGNKYVGRAPTSHGNDFIGYSHLSRRAGDVHGHWFIGLLEFQFVGHMVVDKFNKFNGLYSLHSALHTI